MKKLPLLFSFFLLIFFNILFAQHYKKDGTPDMRFKENKIRYSTSSTSYTRTSFKNNTISTALPKYSSNPRYSFVATRNKNGRIRRSSSATYLFKKQTNYPHGRPGYVIDHIIPLKRGGCDCPSNMQWQTKADAKAKDKVE